MDAWLWVAFAVLMLMGGTRLLIDIMHRHRVISAQKRASRRKEDDNDTD